MPVDPDPDIDSCGAAEAADTVFDTIMTGEDFSIPDIDLSGDEFQIPDEGGNPLFAEITPITIEQLTTKTVGGTGVFDILMSTMKVHLDEQYKSQRITGREFTEAYIANSNAAMQTAVQFLLGKDMALYNAYAAQAAAQMAEISVVKARIELKMAELQTSILGIQAKTAEANYAKTKMELSILDAQYCNLLLEKAGKIIQNDSLEYNLTNLLPKQNIKAGFENDLLELQKIGADTDNDIKAYTLGTMMVKQASMLDKQIIGVDTDNDIKAFTLSDILPKQRLLISEQGEAQRAQTLNTRSDGTTTVVGLMGKQKDLYTQQITSYQRDAETKAVKMMIDSWVAQKTIDEGLDPPGVMTNPNIQTIFATLQTNLELGDVTATP